MARPIPVTEWSKIPAETAAYYSYVTTPHASVAHPVGGPVQDVLDVVKTAWGGVPQQEAVEERQVQAQQGPEEGVTGQETLTSLALSGSGPEQQPVATVYDDPAGLGSGATRVPVQSPMQAELAMGTGAFAVTQDHGAGLPQKGSVPSHPIVVSGEQDGSGLKARKSVESHPLHGLSKEQQRLQVDLALAARKQTSAGEDAGEDLIRAFHPPKLAVQAKNRPKPPVTNALNPNPWLAAGKGKGFHK